MPAAVHIDRAFLRGWPARLHQASAHLLRPNDAGRVGATDVQARGPSSAAVWGVRGAKLTAYSCQFKDGKKRSQTVRKKVKTRTLENRKGAAPKIALNVTVSANRRLN